mmetsp:Transcript_10990/g.34985  ORF Transcript_10990/g.34985 Transcript_10990/m.34985 type:complete len:289 (-) Transcript_10990:829-1695(-)
MQAVGRVRLHALLLVLSTARGGRVLDTGAKLGLQSFALLSLLLELVHLIAELGVLLLQLVDGIVVVVEVVLAGAEASKFPLVLLNLLLHLLERSHERVNVELDIALKQVEVVLLLTSLDVGLVFPKLLAVAAEADDGISEAADNENDHRDDEREPKGGDSLGSIDGHGDHGVGLWHAFGADAVDHDIEGPVALLAVRDGESDHVLAVEEVDGVGEDEVHALDRVIGDVGLFERVCLASEGEVNLKVVGAVAREHDFLLAAVALDEVEHDGTAHDDLATGRASNRGIAR